jgi:SAM-dependent methyltransferase
MQMDNGLSNQNQPACPLCGCARARLHVRTHFNLTGATAGGYRVVECSGCRFRYLYPRPDSEELAGFYQADYPAWSLQVKGEGTAVDREQESVSQRFLQIADKRLSLVERFLTRPWTGLRVLDIGCGNGAFLMQLLRRHEVEAWGTDINAASLAGVGRLEPRLHQVTGKLSQAPLPTGYFDVITLWHVLEHDGDPVGSLRRVQRWLRPGGLLLAEVPNAGGLIASLCGSNWIGWDLPRHLVHFSAASLRQAAKKAGWPSVRVLRDYTLNPITLSPFLASLALWDRQRRGRQTMKRAVYHRWDGDWTETMLALINGMERMLGGNGLVLVASKQGVARTVEASRKRVAAA